nr:MAG: p-loop containing NTP hydrolase [Lokiarchaeota virus Skoll Meg22_1214]
MNTILLNAHQRTGQHWIVFVLANYHKILTENISKPLGWEIAGTFMMFSGKKMNQIIQRGFLLPDDFPHSYPLVFRSEASWDETKKFNLFHEMFDKKVYLTRNALDTFISMFYYYKKVNHPRKRETILELFMDFLPYYIEHNEKGMKNADLILKYEEMKENPNIMKKLLSLIYPKIDEEIFKKALEFGGFDSIHEIQPEHARSGKVGQYKKEIPEHQLEYLISIIPKKFLPKNI